MGTFKERRNKRRNEVRLARNATMKEIRSILLRITTRLLLHRVREIRLRNEYLFREKLAGKYTRVRGRKDGEKRREKRSDAKEEKVKVGSNFFFSLKVGRRYVQRLTKALHETSSISPVP